MSPERLDVDRLARAMQAADGVAWPILWTRKPQNFDWIARQVAAKYSGEDEEDLPTYAEDELNGPIPW